MSRVVLFVLLYISFLCANTILNETFDNDSLFSQWQRSDSAEIRRDTLVKYSGTSSLRIDYAAPSSAFYTTLMLHKSSAEVAQGFHVRFYALIEPDQAIAGQPADPVSTYSHLFALTVLTPAESSYALPDMLIKPGPEKSGTYEAELLVREAKAGSPKGLPITLAASQWHCIELFVSLKGDTLFDSLYVDNSFMGNQRVALKDKPETFHKIVLGGWKTHGPLGVKAVYFDDLVVSTNRIGPIPGFKGLVQLNTSDYKPGDSMEISIALPSEPGISYLELNVSTVDYAANDLKQWSTADSLVNLIYNIDLVNGDLSRLRQGGAGTLFEKQHAPAFTRDVGNVRLAIVLPRHFKAGKGHVYCRAVAKGGKSVVLPKAGFRIKKRSAVFIFISITIVSHVFIFSFLFYMRRRRRIRTASSPIHIDLAAKIDAYMADHYKDKISQDDISKLVGLSNQRTVAIYKAVKGVTPVQKLSDLRMEKAKELLVSSAISISEVAYAVGFTDPRLFQRNFKKAFGVTPGQCREKGA